MTVRQILAGLCLAVLTASASAEVRLPSVIGDHMVLQRGKPIPIWGWDDAGTIITVGLDGATSRATAADDGTWMVRLPARSAGGPFELTINGTTTMTLSDVLVGEVWLCSGQSNMEWPVRLSNDAEQEIAAADHPRIRHIKVPHRPARTPQTDVETSGWQVCDASTVGDFTAVGYFFARHLQGELDVPVGLLGSNWGGTRIEPWIPPVGFESVAALRDIASTLSEYPAVREDGTVKHQSALALYNGMIHPLQPYGMRGAIWYQGESNLGEGMQYHEKMKALIKGWRRVWDDATMPFYFVQLAPFRYRGTGPNDALRLPEMWEAQAATLDLPYTGMAVTTDVANLTDIHPRNKQDVGKRLALWALAETYDTDGVVYSGPVYRTSMTEGAKIRLLFEHVGRGLKSRDGAPLSWFTIAGADGVFVEAQAVVEGPSVVVWSDAVKSPRAVRFGWHQEAEPNLINAAGLPAVPFRTDR